MTWNLIVWALLFLVFAILEGCTVQLVSIWCAAGSLVGFVVALCGGSIPLQMILFIVVSAVLVAATRPFTGRFLKPKKIPTNADSLIGMTALVTEDINNMHSQGRVFVQGQDWAARANTDATIHRNCYVRIDDIQGVTLHVHLVSPEDSLNAEAEND